MLPFDSWAEHYETVMERSLGSVYYSLTECALAEVRRATSPPATILDCGAGCGRLAVPLAARGYRVRAVEPSSPMLGELRRRAFEAGLDVDVPGAPIRTHNSTIQEYPADARHDLALCVFTVLAHLLDEAELDAAIGTVHRSLEDGGLFLLDIPHPEMFAGFDDETANLIRSVTIDPLGGGLHDYRETTTLRTPDGQESYEDRFVIRYWEPEVVSNVLERHGFRSTEDVSGRFTGLGADYLLVRSG